MLIMKLVDSHAHISMPVFSDDLDQVVSRAINAGVIAVINPTIDSNDFIAALKLEKKYRGFIFVALGLAPQTATLQQLNDVLEVAKQYKGRYVAIGEVGLDFYWVKSVDRIVTMRKIFESMLGLAKELNLPLIIHARSAYGKNAYVQIAEYLKKYDIESAVFHAFFGRKSDLELIVNNGWMIGIPTVYLRRRELWKILELVPLDNILLETDSPYLAPTKGTRNEPANVVKLVNLLTTIKHMDNETVASIILENTKKFFNISL